MKGYHADLVIVDEIQEETPAARVFEKVYDATWDIETGDVQDAITLVLNAFGEEVRALPELGATKSRDFGRGYAVAIRDVMTLLNRSGATLL